MYPLDYIVILSLFAMVLSIGIPLTQDILRSRKAKAVASKPARSEVKSLSMASRQILEEYNKLPVDSRTFGDIHHVLRALDVKHGVSETDAHFTRLGYRYFSWNCDCRHFDYKCGFVDYLDLHAEIQRIREALAAQAHALAVAGVEGDLSQVSELKQRLRDEANLISTVTKELA